LNDICKRIEEIRRRIEEAAKRRGRKPEEITLLAAVKGVDSERLKESISCGIQDIGENRVQEAIRHRSEIVEAKPIHWHMIGHLQRNKVKKALEIFDMIQSIDGLPLSEEVSQRALSLGKRMEILVEVNTSGEESKYGIPSDPLSVLNFVERLAFLDGIRFRGLLTLGPFTPDPEGARPAYRALKSLRDFLEDQGIETPILSMGMTHDFEVAIEEGSTMVRIGTGIFGQRFR